MFTPINSRNEELRAQAIIDSLTDAKKAGEVFASRNSQTETAELTADTNRNNGQSVIQALKALRLNRNVAVDEFVQSPVCSPRQVPTSG